MSLKVIFIRNVATHEVLTWYGSQVTMRSTPTSPNNFRLNHQGFTASVPHYHIQRYNNASQKLQAPTSTTSPQSTIPTGSAGTLWFVEQSASGSSQSGIRLYTTSGGTKWYLHANPLSGSASVVREDHLSNYSTQEFKFNLVNVNVNDIDE